MTSDAVTVCTWGGQLGDAEGAFTLARKVSGSWGVDLKWLVLGSLPEQASEIARRHGVAGIDHIADTLLNDFQPDVHVEALAQYCAQSMPKAIRVISLTLNRPNRKVFKA